MRKAFLLLLLANVAFFAYQYVAPVWRDSTPVAQQLNPERIRLIAPEEFGRIGASRRTVGCIELGPIATGDATRAEEAVSALGKGLKVSSRRVDEPARWWVYIPPLATRQAAAQQAAELKKQGVEDSSVINDDSSFRYAISLGVFRSEDAANNRAEVLRKRGVRSVAVAARDGSGPRVYVQLREAPEAVRLKLFDVKDSFPGSEVRACQAN